MHEYEYGGGYRLSDRMVNEFRALDSSAYSNIPSSKLHVVSTSSPSAFSVAGVSEEVSQCACNWETHEEDLVMPQPVLERLVACLIAS
jgi:hypothetical protein